MINKLSDHADWLPPHSSKWYTQIGKTDGAYKYPWNSTIVEPNGETLFSKEVESAIANLKVLDVGCGHGEFTRSWSSIVEEIIGFDVTEEFLKQINIPFNVQFVAGDAKAGLPFEEDSFDCAYNRMGPTSAYPDLQRIVKQGGQVIGPHPGDDLGKELTELFPGLYDPIPKSDPILNKLKEKLSTFTKSNIQMIRTVEYLHSPLDVIRMRTFGQKTTVYEECLKSLQDITQIFERHATEKGLPLTFSRYLLTATV